MATTVTRSNYWMLKLTSDSSPVFNFKFVVEIWVDGAKLLTLKQPKNNNDSAHINFEKIVKNYIKVTNKHDNTIGQVGTNNIDYDSIHLMPINRTDRGWGTGESIADYPISKNTDTLKTFTFKFYEEYSDTANGTVSVSSSTTADDKVYPLINYANEWDDKMEFDADKFSLNGDNAQLTQDPYFQSATHDWADYDSPGGAISYDEANDEMTLQRPAAHSYGRIKLASSIASTDRYVKAGAKYVFRYKVLSSTGVTQFRIFNGAESIEMPFTDGYHYFEWTGKRPYVTHLRMDGGVGSSITFDQLFLFQKTQESSFLTDLPTSTQNINETSGLIPHLTSLNDYRTLSFINTDDGDFDTKNGVIEYKFFTEPPVFEAAIGAIGTRYYIPTNYVGKITVPNIPTRGGKEPDSASLTDEERLLFVGVGGGNVKSLMYSAYGRFRFDEFSSSQNNIKYYTVNYAQNPADNNRVYIGSESVTNVVAGDYCYVNVVGDTDWSGTGAPSGVSQGTKFYSLTNNITGTGKVERWHGTPMSKYYLFEISRDTTCNSTRFDEYSLAWKNKYGTWDYYMFDGEHSDVRNYKREDQSQKVAGSWGASDFAIESYERGKVQKVGGTKQTTINTRFITDDYNDYFNGLLMSNEVLLLPKIKSDYSNVYDAAIPINIKDTSLAYKTNLKDKLVQYSFTFEYAHDLKQRV